MGLPHVSHVEWCVTDLARSEAFLTGLFGWRFAIHSRHYRLYVPPQGTCVGLLEVAKVRPCRSTLIHIQVDNVDAYLAHACQLGGSVDTPRTEIPGHGWYAQVLDPDGNVVGLFQAPTVQAPQPSSVFVG